MIELEYILDEIYFTGIRIRGRGFLKESSVFPAEFTCFKKE